VRCGALLVGSMVGRLPSDVPAIRRELPCVEVQQGCASRFGDRSLPTAGLMSGLGLLLVAVGCCG
jgi:hypothetical protein